MVFMVAPTEIAMEYTKEQLESVNQWSANACDVARKQYAGGDWYFIYKGKEYNYEWTILDPRCREVIREKFNINTKRNHGGWSCHKELPMGYLATAEYETIEEAEIAVIMDIWEGK